MTVVTDLDSILTEFSTRKKKAIAGLVAQRLGLRCGIEHSQYDRCRNRGKARMGYYAMGNKSSSDISASSGSISYVKRLILVALS